ncbi:MAG: type II toxin-antitoxin system Phd/YefM family antitoxin [Ilumatobacteraceae bacterium]
MSTSPLTEVRDNLSEIIENVASTGEEWVITKHGRPVAVILGYDEYESLIETVNVISDDDAMDAITAGLADLDESGGG